MEEQVQEKIQQLVNQLKNDQREDGAWRYCFENVPMTDAYAIIVLRTLENKDESFIHTLVERLLIKQEDNGAWKLYADEMSGNLSATTEAYTALLFSGYKTKQDPEMQKAESFILTHGGLSEVHLLTKMMLALNGLFPWPRFFPVPLTLVLVPEWWPINFYELSGYARVHFAPILIAAHRKFSIQTKWTPDLSHLFVTRSNLWSFDFKFHKLNEVLQSEIKKLARLPLQMHQKALKQAELYILKRIERDGTLYSYASATFFMIYGLLALNYEKDAPTIKQAIEGIKQLRCCTEKNHHIQNSPSTVWDTALISYALLEAGVEPEESTLQKSSRYLLQRQHYKKGDWAIHNPHVLPGGWGFSQSNTINPDVDDTQSALRTIGTYSMHSPKYKRAWQLGVNWLLSMQNSDGGWPAFEKNTDSTWLTLLPLQNAEDAAIDPSTPDLTGRALEFLGNCLNFNSNHPRVQTAVKWLIDHQKEDGSWYGRWGVCYIYGTWAAITGLKAVGIPNEHPSIQKGVQWLLDTQRKDGGWGESCESDIKQTYIPLTFSTPSQTAWAVDGLISTLEKSTPAIKKGIEYLLHFGDESEAVLNYPTGAGLPGNFYIRYHSYNKIWPLLTLSHFIRK